MKTHAILAIALAILAASGSHAAFETWTNKDGRAAELELVSVTDKDGTKVGEFHMKNGKTVAIPATNLSEADAKKLDDFLAAKAAAELTVIDKCLEGNLSIIENDKAEPYKKTHPTKYYVFYYSASWCPPCHRFTPSLVEFYNKNKSAEFEIYLIPSDRSDGDTEKYVKDMKQPWPYLKLAKKGDFVKEFNHGITGIPALVICDTQGKVLKNSFDNGQYIGPDAVMQELAKLLGK